MHDHGRQRARPSHLAVAKAVGPRFSCQIIIWEVSDNDCKKMLLEELTGRLKYLPEDVAVREFRSVMPFYIKGLPGSAVIKVRLCSANSLSEVKEILDLA